MIFEEEMRQAIGDQVPDNNGANKIDFEITRRMFATTFYALAGGPLYYLRPPFTFLELTDCIIMEMIKKLFYETLPIGSGRSNLWKDAGVAHITTQDELEGNTIKDEMNKRNMRFSRTLEYVQYYRTERANAIVAEGGVAPAELLPDDLSYTPNRMKGHQISDMQFLEMCNLSGITRTGEKQERGLRLLKAIINKRIIDKEKITYSLLKDYLDEYANYVEELKAAATVDDRSLVFNTFALYTLESIFCVDFAYDAICAAEKIPGSDPYDAAKLLAGKASIVTMAGMVSTDNRFILHRNELIPLALCESSADMVREKIGTYLYIKDFALWGTDGKSPYLDQMRGETTLEDWANFIRRYYPLVDRHPTYDWTKKRIRAYRELMNKMIDDVPPPKSPPRKKKSSSSSEE